MRLKIYATLFALFVALDAVMFFLYDTKRLISWQSFIHAGWVVFAASLLLLVAFIGKAWINYVALTLHFLVFVLSLTNQFIPINETFNYNCMLFNLGLFTVYYFSINKKQVGGFT